MTNMTLAIPEELHSLMQKHKQIKWSEVAREALWSQAKKMELLDSLLSKSKLTKKDVDILSETIKKKVAQRHGL